MSGTVSAIKPNKREVQLNLMLLIVCDTGNLLGGGDYLEAEPPLDVLARLDRTKPQVLHHHRQGVLPWYKNKLTQPQPANIT